MNTLNDIFEVVWAGRLHGQATRNVRHYRLSAIGSSGVDNNDAETADALASKAEAFWNVLRTELSTEFTMEAIGVQKIFPLPRLVGTIRIPGSTAGDEEGSALPSTVCVVTRVRTPFAGRRFRGRNFWAGAPVFHEDDSTLVATERAAWSSLAEDLSVPLNPTMPVGKKALTFTPAILHKDTMTTTDINDWGLDVILRTQRRRQVGKGM